MLALSTSWNAHRHTDGELLLREIEDLGFHAVALGKGTPASFIAGLKRLITKGRIRAVAMEGYFPSPAGSQEQDCSCYHLTTSDRSARHKAVQWTAQTIDYAAELDARVVILDLGFTSLSGLTASLARLVERNQLHTRRYVRHKLAAVTRRSRETRRVLDRARESLEELLPRAKERGVTLALKGQGPLEEIPNEEEILRLLEDHRGSGFLGYWHDSEAAQLKANLGLLDPGQWLATLQSSLQGTYLQDLAWPNAPRCLPFAGTVDYQDLIPRLPRGVPLVWRVPPTVPSQEIRQALLKWDEEFPLVA